MLPVAKAFLDIALLRRGPQDLPASRLLLYVALAALTFSYVLAISPLHRPPQSLLRAAVDIGFIAAFVYLLLSVAGRRARIGQTLTALFGAGAVLNLISWPVLALLQSSDGAVGIGLLVLLLLFWEIAVTAHVLRHALERTLSFAIGIALLYVFGAYTFSNMVFHTPD